MGSLTEDRFVELDDDVAETLGLGGEVVGVPDVLADALGVPVADGA